MNSTFVRRGATIAVALGAMFGLLQSSVARDASASVDPLAPLEFLLGSWEAGANTGAPGAGTGGTTFERGLQGAVIIRTNHAEYPASSGRPASTHEDLMVIYSAGDGRVEADYFDSEAHKIHYAVTIQDSNHVMFLGTAVPEGAGMRLTYARREGGSVDGEFAIAPPDHPESFRTYLTWNMHRKGR